MGFDINTEDSEQSSSPLVSICVITYQHAKYIEDCMRGILNQSYSCIELIVLDDASTDGTADIIRGFEGKFKENNIKFRFIKHDTNGGNLPANCNEMIRLTTGKYIKILSGDDILLENYTSSLVEFLEKRDCSVAYSNAYFISDEYKYGERFAREKILTCHYEVPAKDMFKKLLKNNWIPALAVMLKRDIYDRYGLYDENIRFEDWDFWLRLAGKETFGYLDRPLCLYRKAETGMSNCNSRSKFAFNYNEELKVMKKHLGRVPWNERQNYIYRFYKRWTEVAGRAHYLDMYLRIEFKLVRWLLGLKLKGPDALDWWQLRAQEEK